MDGKKTAVLVAGSWGTALASVLADNGHEVMLWTRRKDQEEEINRLHTNSRYLPGTVLNERIRATIHLEEAVRDAAAIVIVAPSASLREVASRLRGLVTPDTAIIHATKGFEPETLKRMSEVIAEELPEMDPGRIVVLSGPSHAEEVVKRCPTTVVVAAEQLEAAEFAQDLFMSRYFRVYTNPDIIGVEVAGALKNIIALGAGMNDGLEYGDNAKAALMTRGLSEIIRLGIAMGSNPLTFAGLAGLGDMVVTCTSRHSRNWRAGYRLGQGVPLEQVLSEMNMVVEGVKTTKAAYALARKYGITMPITEALYQVLFEGKAPRLAVEELMGRLRRHEIEEVAQEAASKWL